MLMLQTNDSTKCCPVLHGCCGSELEDANMLDCQATCMSDQLEVGALQRRGHFME